jgi:hypothetical protein
MAHSLASIRNAALAARAASEAEDGHAIPAMGTLISGVGSVVLGIGAANGTGWLAVTGGIVSGVGVLAAGVLHHREVDYAVFRRLEALEGKK